MPRKRNGFRRFVLLLFGLTLFFAFISGVYYALKRARSQPPVITLIKVPTFMGKKSELEFSVKDDQTGLREILVELDQGGIISTLFDEKYPGPKLLQVWKMGSIKEKHVQLELSVADLKLKEGQAKLKITARDYSLRHIGGNQAVYEQTITIDLTPPHIEAMSKQHYINQGGAEFIVYRVSKDAATSGVKVGDYFFPGCQGPFTDPEVRMAFFAVPYDVPANVDMKLVAMDAAGNSAEAQFFYKVFPKKFPQAKVQITDAFLQKKMPEFLENNLGLHRDSDWVKVFLEVNGPLRRQTRDQIRELTKKTQPKMLWSEAFHQLRNSKVESNFAQRRTYVYNGKEVDRSVHLGYDLAVTTQTDIEAANDGIVVYSGYLTIYGQTVILDHGCGLFTLYGHMSSRRVNVGDRVKRGDTLGQTGNTGLAMGDHLHFSVLLDGVEVDCKEWWDPRWIKVRVLDKMHALSS